jgi:cytochrome o ubiquinol oxidase subunit 2
VSEDVRPLRVQVVALDWKWLFIYPDYGVASVNEMAAPVDVPIEFQITSSTVMNAFYVPALAGMIYAMPAMETRLHAVINRVGDFEGFSSNYSGAGFSHMRFAFKARSGADFDAWVAELRASPEVLSRARYQELELPSAKEPVRHFKSTADGLYSAILNLCVDPNKMCMHDMMKIDAAGGLGLGSVYNVAQLRHDQPRAALQPARYVLAMCTAEPERFLTPAADAARYGSSAAHPL